MIIYKTLSDGREAEIVVSCSLCGAGLVEVKKPCRSLPAHQHARCIRCSPPGWCMCLMPKEKTHA